ncbi:MAG: hypothetical protein ACFFCQ_18580 [Promethearchaeota archaeon]
MGGSLQAYPLKLKQICQILLATVCQERIGIVIIPGGGICAQKVREWHQHLDFSDETAHYAAIATMDVYAWILADLLKCSPPIPFSKLSIDDKGIKVIAPSLTFKNSENLHPLIKKTFWEITSDSLAAWVAKDLSQRLILLKILPTELNELKFKPLSDKEIEKCHRLRVIDEVLPELVKQYNLSIYLCDAMDPKDLQRYLEKESYSEDF